MKKKLLLIISVIFLIMILILINYHEKILGKYNQLKNLKVRNDSLTLKLENKEKELSELTEYVKINIIENLNFILLTKILKI